MMIWNRVRATSREHLLIMPGDELIPNPADTLTHATTVHCSAIELWPWLAQMGADRAGWYSYDWIDNGRRHSAEHIVPSLQQPPVGSIFPALPGVNEGFVLLEKETNHWLVLGWPSEEGGYTVTWSFLLNEIGDNVTRLIVRVRASAGYRFHGVPQTVGLWMARVVHFIMQRKQLLEIASRAERLAS
jgi:hypothetical protein